MPAYRGDGQSRQMGGSGCRSREAGGALRFHGEEPQLARRVASCLPAEETDGLCLVRVIANFGPATEDPFEERGQIPGDRSVCRI